MKLTTYFRLAITACLNTEKWGNQTKLANALNLDKTYLNQILKGKRKIGERYREIISDYLGYKYEDLIRLGRIISEMSEIIPEQQKLITKNIKRDLYKKIRESQQYTKKEMAKLLKIPKFEYEFKEKGVIPFTIKEICLIMNLTEKKPKEIAFDNHSKIIKNIEKELKKMSEQEKTLFFIELKEKFSETGKTMKECYEQLREIRKNSSDYK